MKFTGRLLTLLLALALVFTMLPAMAYAEETDTDAAGQTVPEAGPKTETVTTVIPFQVNPLYEGILTESDFDIPDFPEVDPEQVNPQAITYQTIEQAGKKIRDNMKNQTESFTVYVKSASYDHNAVGDDMMEVALEHTGKPTEGDYLMWQYGGYKATVSRSYNEYSELYEYTYDFVFTYYTTYAQESQVYTSIQNLINSLGLRNKSDYEKICGVYDWICENVTYDYANLEDTSYTLKYTAYAALINKTAVCQGYALLFYRMMLELGVDNRLIAGLAASGEAHGWNIVQIGDYYYSVDSTWDAGQEEYNYFLTSTWNFGGHYRYLDYESWEFHEEFPMAAENYDPEGTAEIDPYIYVGMCGDDAYWLLCRDGSLEIFGTGSTMDANRGVSSKRPEWLYWDDHITSVIVDEGITAIGTELFEMTDNLEEVTLPSTVTTIGRDAFYYCQKLKTVNFSEGLVTIGSSAFQSCAALEEAVFPSTLTTIGSRAFTNCDSLTEITISSNITSIDSEAFRGCDSLHTLNLDIATVPSDVFVDCPSLSNIVFSENVKIIKEEAFDNCDGLVNLNFPETLESISGFSNCDGLVEVTIPEGPAIGQGAFENCTNLEVVHFPDSLKEIGQSAFSGCTKISDLQFPTDLEIIGGGAFRGCTKITELHFPAGLKTIGGSAFYDASVTTLQFPEGLLSIGGNAFGSCDGLTEITIPASVTMLSGFEGCVNLSSVTLYEGVETIGNSAFKDCTSLEEIHIPGTVKRISAYAFQNTGLKSLELPDGLVTIEMDAFLNCDGLTAVVIPESVVNPNGFQSCSGLISVYINGAGEIGGYAFYGCTSLENVYIGENITAVTGSAFQRCTGLKEITIPANVGSVSGFSGCTALETVHLYNTGGISGYAFNGCNNLKNVEITNATFIGHQAFSGCSFERIEIPASITKIDSYAFGGSAVLKEIKFMGDCPKIDSYAFRGYSSNVTATAYYPYGNDTWTEDKLLDYGGTITWVSYAPPCTDHTYEAVVTTPTCQAQGYTTYTCTNCGDSYVDDYTDPVDHSYEDGTCIWCGDETYTIKWIAGTTSLNGTIDLNIYVALSENLLDEEDAFVRFTHSGVTVDVPVSAGIESEKGGTICYRFSCEIFAKQVADTVTVQVMKDDEVIGKALNYSVMQYCVNQIKNSSDAELVAVCKTLLNYATAAQLYFDYNTENLANASLSEADKVLPEVDASAYKYAITGSEDGIKASSATLMLESEVKIRVYFKLTGDKTIEDYTFTINGKEVQIQQNAKGYYIETDGIAAKNLEEMYEFCVGGITVNYGALSYVNSKVTSSKTAELEKNLAEALYAYYEAAEALLG